MDFLAKLNWSCIEINENETTLRVILTEPEYSCDNTAIGDVIQAGSLKGTLIASSSMGVTVFDLFNEIITKNDMIKFLSDKGITEKEYEGAALILRCFLLLMDLNKESLGIMSSIDPVEIKVEEIDFEYIDNENEDDDVELIQTNLYDSESDESVDSDKLAGFHVSNKKKKEKKVTSQAKNNICRGRGCCCNSQFKSREDVRRHYVDKECYKCKKCEACYGSRRLLRLHMRNDHPESVKTVAVQDGHKCRISKCPEVFTTAGEREQHEKEYKHFVCEPCNLSFFKLVELLRHRREDMCKEMICENCGIDYFATEPSKRYRKITRHRAACYNERKFICEECGEGFNSNIKLRRHMRCHTVEAQQKRLLYQLNNMARQEARRKNPRSFACDQCDRAYTTNQKLKFHKIAVHGDGQSRYPCSKCDKVLLNPGTLQSHLRKIHHPDAIVGYCEVCGKGYHTERRIQECCIKEKKCMRPESVIQKLSFQPESMSEYMSDHITMITDE